MRDLLAAPVVPDVFGVMGDWIFSRQSNRWRAQVPPWLGGLSPEEESRLMCEHHMLAISRCWSRDHATTMIDTFEFTSPSSLAAFVRHLKGEK